MLSTLDRIRAEGYRRINRLLTSTGTVNSSPVWSYEVKTAVLDEIVQIIRDVNNGVQSKLNDWSNEMTGNSINYYMPQPATAATNANSRILTTGYTTVAIEPEPMYQASTELEPIRSATVGW